MNRLADWAQVLHDETTRVDAQNYLTWLLILSSESVRRPLARVIQLERDAAHAQLLSLGMPSEMAAVVIGLAAEDAPLRRLAAIAARASDLARSAGRGAAVNLVTATSLAATSVAAIEAAIQGDVAGPVAIDRQTRSSMLGGVHITIGTNIVDQSFERRVRDLAHQIRS